MSASRVRRERGQEERQEEGEDEWLVEREEGCVSTVL